jgi:hypothetical protein
MMLLWDTFLSRLEERLWARYLDFSLADVVDESRVDDRQLQAYPAIFEIALVRAGYVPLSYVMVPGPRAGLQT